VEDAVHQLRRERGNRRDAVADVIPDMLAALVGEEDAEVVDQGLVEALRHRLLAEEIVEDLQHQPARPVLFVRRAARKAQQISQRIPTWGMRIGAATVASPSR
jgi:hypothetical protein